jgi:7TM-HD extracellular
MVNAARRFQLICAAALIAISAHAKDLAAYQIGDKAEDDITASVAFDVVDAQATAALKLSEALKIPAIFLNCPADTNAAAKKFLAVFAAARSNFSAALVAQFHQPTIDETTIASPDFGNFVTAFNGKNKNFPVTAALAATWARGDSGQAFQDKWLNLLLQATSRPARPDKLPKGFVVRKNVHLVPVASAEEKMSLNDVRQRGKIIAETTIPTISRLRAEFREEFLDEEQPLARVLSEFLQPDCLPDVPLTREMRAAAVRRLAVAEHFDAGQIIVRRGATIDARTKAALDALNEKLMPAVLSQQIAAERDRAQREQEQVQLESEQAQRERQQAALAQQQQQQAQSERARAESEAQSERAQAAAMHEQALDAQSQALKIRARNEWLLAVLAVVSVLGLAILWRLLRQQRAVPISVPAKLQWMEKGPAIVPAEIAPFLAQTLKDAVVQGLAVQRAELLEAQRLAAVEITELVRRLDQLQAPMQERLRAYQERIDELQKNLAERTEENRELLKLKIEMMRRQLEAERGRVEFN